MIFQKDNRFLLLPLSNIHLFPKYTYYIQAKLTAGYQTVLNIELSHLLSTDHIQISEQEELSYTPCKSLQLSFLTLSLFLSWFSRGAHTCRLHKRHLLCLQVKKHLPGGPWIFLGIYNPPSLHRRSLLPTDPCAMKTEAGGLGRADDRSFHFGPFCLSWFSNLCSIVYLHSYTFMHWVSLMFWRNPLHKSK